MKKATVTSIKRFAVHDGPGIRTTVFLKGCPLHCLWCHNPEGISPKPQLAYHEHKCLHCGSCVAACPNHAHGMENGRHVFDRARCTACGACVEPCLGDALTLYGQEMSAQEVMKTVLEDRLFYETSGGGLTLSGGEPLVQAEFCAELLHLAKQEGIHTAVDTCGAVREDALALTLADTDLYLYDLKHPDPERHKALTGIDNARSLGNLRRLAAEGKPVEIRIPLIPTLNDAPETLRGMGEILSGMQNVTRVKVLPYHDYARSKYLSLGLEDTMPHVAPPEDDALEKACDILRSFGVPAVSGKKA